ncbi:MAG: hypothetical protein IKM85_01440 [Bacteroidales bacterium]|nr:hypothetical protein [Bacteroidales bacterium]
MKKSIFMTLVAVVVCGLAVTLFTQCNKDKEKNPEVTMAYYVSVSPDVLSVADVEINYLDASGAKQKEVLTDSVWRKPITTNTLPLTEGVWAKITPKTNIAEGNYQLRIQTVAAFAAILSDGTKVHEAWTNQDYDISTTAQNADEVAAWCAQSPTIAQSINKEGVTENAQVDFGGNFFGYDTSDWFGDLTCWFLIDVVGLPDWACDGL